MRRETVNNLYNWIDTLSDDELFKQEIENGATTKTMWPVYKWIGISIVM